MRTGTFLRVLLGAFVLAATVCQGQNSDVLRAVEGRYKGKAVALRSPAPGGRLAYKAGEAIAEPRDAEWWQDALIACKSFKLKDRSVELRGERLMFGYDPGAGKLVTLPVGDVRLTVTFSGIPDAVAVTREFDRIFHDPDTPLADVAPSYWQACLRGPSAQEKPLRRCMFQGVRGAERTSELKSNPGGEVSRQSTVFVRTVDESGAPHYDIESRTVYRVGPKVSAPKSLYTPDPEYTNWARSKRISGTCLLRMIVNKSGHVEDVVVVRPLGYGLDDVSALTVQTWKFEPAMFEGRPVPVELNVETNFRLY